MEEYQAVVLGIIQGLTEFLPISSSGHLILVPSFFGWEDFTNNLTFDVSLHVGTALAVVAFFWKDWIRLLTSFFKNIPSPKKVLADYDSRFLLMIVVGSIPAAIVGLAFEDVIEETIREPQIVVGMLILFALVLWLAEKVGKKRRGLADLTFVDAIFVGLAQAISLIPGVSRSGITISAGLFAGISREAAARFSFLLSTPAIVGAGILRVKDLLEGDAVDLSFTTFMIGMIVSAIVGYLAIRYLLKYVTSRSYYIFVWYRIAVGVLALLVFF